MSDHPPPPACHCAHVVVVETKVSIAQWLLAIIAAGLIATMISSVGNLVSLRVRSSAIGRAGERLAPDRVPEPESAP